MINPEKINWDDVQGLILGLYFFSNEGNLPIIWDKDEKAVHVLENGVPVLSYKKSQIRDVIYK